MNFTTATEIFENLANPFGMASMSITPQQIIAKIEKRSNAFRLGAEIKGVEEYILDNDLVNSDLSDEEITAIASELLDMLRA